MTNTISLQEPQVNALIGTWTGLRLQRGPNSTNLAAFADVTAIPYVLGQTTYTYVDNTGAASDWYRMARYGPVGLLGPYSPAWPVTADAITAGDGARRSLKNCRRILARRLGGFQVVTTTADGAIDGTSVEASHLANQLDGNRYRAWWIMPTDGVSVGQVRSIGESALDPSRGVLTIGPAMTSQIVQGTQLELSKLLPPDDFGGMMGMRQALNLALAECWAIDRLALASIANTATYDLSLLGDWVDPDTISEFYGPVLGTGIPLAPWGGFGPRQQGSTVALDVAPGLATGQAMSIELTRPADTFIKISGVWTDNQQGFTNDDDECLLQPKFLAEVALVYCLEALADSTTGAPAARYLKRSEEQRKSVNIMKWTGLPHPSERSDHRAAAYGGNDWMSWLK